MYITPEDIYNKTNGGLDIIKDIFPDADEKKKFKIRSGERTPSASLKKTKDNIWLLTDFGADGKAKTAIDLFMQHENVEFKEAMNMLAARYNITGSFIEAPVIKPLFSSRPATNKEKEKEYLFKTKDFTGAELQLLGKYVTADLCKKYNLYSILSYTYIKDRKALTFTSTEDFPIFLYDHGTWKKLYKPRESKKEYRFVHIGERPPDYIFGLDLIEKEFKKYKKSEQVVDDYNTENNPEVLTPEDKEEKIKLDSIYLCSGERDALNLASIGKRVICLNSETAYLSIDKFKYIQRMCKTFYNIPDIDSTGKEMGKRFALQFLNVKTVWLPEDLKNKKDFRGNPCKDIADFFRHYEIDRFEKIVKYSLPLIFWYEVPVRNLKGVITGVKYEINNTTLYEFLNANGFWLYENKNEECGYSYIKETNHIIELIDIKKHKKIKKFVTNYIEEFFHDVVLRNTMYRTAQLKEESFSNLKYKKFDFNDYGKDFQYLFFSNRTWKVTSKGIEEYKPTDINLYVWSDEIIDYNVKKIDEPFTVSTLKDGKYFIDIKDGDFIFMKFLINTSRIYWKKEDEDNEELTKDEQYEEMLHLINKIYCLGYMLHRYKNPSRPWAVFAIDARESMLGESNGGTGKTMFMLIPTYFMRYEKHNGRNRELTKNHHLFANTTEDTDYELIDDADRYFDLHYFLSPITGSMTVNPKHNKPYEIPFDKSPKFGISSNHTPNNLDASVERRLLYTAFSDYYHKKDNNGYYKREWSPYDEFGKNLFNDFTTDEWNKFYNFIAACIKVYLTYEKIDPPMNSIIKRNLRSEMGESFLDWATTFFDDKYNINRFLERSVIYNEYQAIINDKRFTAQKFKKKLQAFAHYKGLTFNPAELINDSINNRIMRKNSDNKSVEHFYLQEPGIKIMEELL